MEKVTSRGLTLLKDTKLSRRKALTGAAGLGIAAAGAATFAPRRAPYVKGQAKTQLQFWTGFTDPDLATLRKIVEQYNAQSTSYEVIVTQLAPAEVTDNTRLITAVRGGDSPDIYHMDRFTVASNAANGLVQPISEFVDEAVRATYLPFAMEEVTYDGQIWGMPLDTDARALYYNIGVLREAGIDPTEFDQSNGPVTWDRLLEVANMASVRDANGTYSRVGFVPYANQAWHYTYGFSWGAQFYDEANCAVTPDDPKMVEAMQWVYDACASMDANAISAWETPRRVPGFPPQQGSLVTQGVAFEVTGDWMINQYAQYAPTAEYGITYLPVPQAGMSSATWSGGWSMVVPEGSTNAEGAVDFISYMCGEPGQRIYTTDTRHLPTITSLTTDPSLYTELSSFFAAQLLPTSNNRPPLPVGSKYWDEMTSAYQAIYLNEAQPAQALATAKENTQADLQQFC
ncbi:MAG: ABC transporter, substrate-binding protein (cluster 1, maltose/g3p/polyamine/iron) [uncultured Thermomicrobiales bacterium]|uniref:ABC transporter, substrate-binding protein (Cluster 1, maltose/g3p/polyamine/iron) n=1 Tax=uncultured Thermomicrobiales bacterium TaxID=1645740 RepID=A0A6J4V5M8_9BACT|nr:MAG: ABC transporter, substrate-binding protein (cluster 1, maltose/g3p/polyamine/iron) [uncultured Thermomicrobiales bacterium]